MAKASNKNLFFDVKSLNIHPKVVSELEKQDPLESRRLWSKVTSAILKDDMDTATTEKTTIEDKQREDTKKREEKGEVFIPKYFNLVHDEQYELKGITSIDYQNKEKGKAQLEEFVFSNTQEVTTSSA
ncbi:hypothetical protein G6F56_010262 [Rhizopus delemar]|nr:hypothetical protein G6F56_010262 [Rhizopus delemar]